MFHLSNCDRNDDRPVLPVEDEHDKEVNVDYIVQSEEQSIAQAKYEDNFFDEIGYNDMVLSVRDGCEQELINLFSEIQSKANTCKEMKHVIIGLESELSRARAETAAAKARDAIEQMECDALVDVIRQMEEHASETQSTLIPQLRIRIEESKAFTEELRQKISRGPGWTRGQEEQRYELTKEIEKFQNDAVDTTKRMSQLNKQVESNEKKLESTIKVRDDLNAQLTTLDTIILEKRNELLTVKQTMMQAQRKHKELEESLNQYTTELSELCTARDETKVDEDRINDKNNRLRAAHRRNTEERDRLTKKKVQIKDDVNAIRERNQGIEMTNAEKLTILHAKKDDHMKLLNDRSRLNKERELVEKKTLESEKEQKTIENEIGLVKMKIAQIERVDLLLLSKEIDMLKRKTKNLENEEASVCRKADLAKRGSFVVHDVIKSNESTLKAQVNEIIALKKAVQQSVETTAQLESETKTDEVSIENLRFFLKKSQVQLSEMETRIRDLQDSTLQDEEIASQLEGRCEAERQRHLDQSKILMGLRDNVRDSKREFNILMHQIRSIKDDITRADKLVFDEHIRLHQVDEERTALEKDIQIHIEQASILNLKKEMNVKIIDRLHCDIDSEVKRRDNLQKHITNTMSQKDIIGAHLVAAKMEIDRLQEIIKPLQSELLVGESSFSRLKGQLEVVCERNKDLTEEKNRVHAALIRQKEQSDVLARLQHDITRQINKNQVLTVELGRPINLHRWRHLQNEDPVRWSLMEKVHKFQRRVISSSDNLILQSSTMESKKKLLATLEHEKSNRISKEIIQAQLSQAKSKYQELNEEVAAQNDQLQLKINETERLKSLTIQLEKTRIEMKSNYIVSFVNKKY